MASEISHIIYAKKYLEKYPSTMNKDEFMLGCVFPDIRRIDRNISRKDTHMHFEKIDLDFSGLSAFEAGWKFHLYCDMRREEILEQEGFYKIDLTQEIYCIPPKLLEDEILYEKFNNWEKLAAFFNNIPKIEAKINVPYETMELWYAILSNYIDQKPDEKAMHVLLSKQPSLAVKADKIMEIVGKLKENKKVMEMLGKVWEKII